VETVFLGFMRPPNRKKRAGVSPQQSLHSHNCDTQLLESAQSRLWTVASVQERFEASRSQQGISDSAEVGKCGDRGAPLPEWHALRV
jgi:hypothetical protein